MLFGKLIWGIFFIVMCSVSSVVSANQCFDDAYKTSAACSAYEYSNLTMYFKDSYGTEHKVLVNRVIKKSNRVLVHANYSFVAKCNGGCGATNDVVNDMLWAFRSANVNNTFYEKVIYVCNPAEEVCCDDTGCTEILGDGTRQKTLTTNPIQSDDTTTAKTRRNGDRIDRAIDRTEGITNIVDNTLRIASNGQQVQADLSQVVSKPMQFQINVSTTNAVTVCVSTGSFCHDIEGTASATDSTAYFDLSHQRGQDFNDNLRDFLDHTYKQDSGMICQQSTSCDSDDNCTITMRCQKY